MKSEYSAQTPRQLGAILTGLRKKEGLTQASVGSRVGLPQNIVSLLEKDPSTASLARVFKLMSALNVELVLRERQPTSSNW